MRLKSAARYFDTCPVYDAYTGALLFKIQTASFLEAAVEGTTAARRVVSLDPSLTLPTHNCILALGQIWLVGGSNPDEWAGTAIRKAYWTKLVTDNFKLLTPAEAALNASGTAIFGSKKFYKEVQNTVTDSEYDPMWIASLSVNTGLERGYFLRSLNTLFRVRVEFSDVDGFKSCLIDEVDEQNLFVSFTLAGSYDPVSDSYLPNITTTTAVILDYKKAYGKTSETDIKFVTGDMSLIVAKSAMLVSTGQELRVQSGRYAGVWRVLGVFDELDSYNLHIRKA